MDTSHIFQYETQLPHHVGFSIFGKAHLIWLIGIILCLCVFVYVFRKYEKKLQWKVLHILGWVLVLLEIGRIAFLWKIHFLSVYELPLHLCGLAGFLCFMHAYTNCDWLAQTIYAACLPGTIGALLFPDWTMYPIMNVINIQAFVFHGLVVFYAIALVLYGVHPSLRKIYQPILLLILLAVPIYAFDLHFKANYMFLQVPSKESPLMFLAKLTGEKYYLAGLILFALVIMILMEALYTILSKISVRKKK